MQAAIETIEMALRDAEDCEQRYRSSVQYSRKDLERKQLLVDQCVAEVASHRRALQVLRAIENDNPNQE